MDEALRVEGLEQQVLEKTPEQIRQEDLQTIAGYRILVDTFARSFFRKEPDLIQFVHRIITRIDDLVIRESDTQYDSKRLVRSKSLVFDVHGEDTSGRKYDLELEKWDASAERAEVHMGAMIAEHLLAGGGFELDENYVIFMCEHDKVGNGRAVNQFTYRNDDLFLENDEIEKKITKHASMDGKTRIIFINGDYKHEDSEVGKLIHDFQCTQAKDMYFAGLANRVRYLKENPEGVDEMCEAMERIRRDDQRRTDMKNSVIYVRNVAKNLHVTVERAMDIVEIHPNDRAIVAQLVDSPTYYRS